MISLDLVKSHLLIEHEEDDELLQHYIDSAILHAENYIHRKIVSDIEAGEGEVSISPSIVQACLLLIGEWYEVRENVTFKKGSETPNGFNSLLWHLRCQSA